MRLKTATIAWLGILVALGTLPASADPGNPAKGKQAFRICMTCHMIGPGAGTRVGPELNGVVGRKAGTLPGYDYSDAMKNSGLTWDEATLFKYLHGPQLMVPGTHMTFAGFTNDQQVSDVIAYLKTFDAQGNPVTAAQ